MSRYGNGIGLTGFMALFMAAAAARIQALGAT
jgi:hypothetical protein